MPQKAQKEDQEIEIDDKDSDEIEVEVLENEDDSKLEAGAKPEQSSDELEQYSDGVQKRISKLTAKMREAERREQAALQLSLIHI